MSKVVAFVFALCLLAPLSGFAAGPHDALTCSGCHGLHTAKDAKVIFAVEADKKAVNPRTKQSYGGITSLCLSCHATPDQGGMGIRPVSAHTSHPFGISNINPKIANVPAELLRDGSFECISCHDPHPSNSNYRYLRVDTNNGADIQKFCVMCHPMKADKAATTQKAQYFNSMDERLFAGQVSLSVTTETATTTAAPEAQKAAPKKSPSQKR
ncbi:MAG: cytochrome c3 family protein [Thermodesulfovibrionales bacterium]|jgi:predicted CXXCH cytochrome family protein